MTTELCCSVEPTFIDEVTTYCFMFYVFNALSSWFGFCKLQCYNGKPLQVIYSWNMVGFSYFKCNTDQIFVTIVYYVGLHLHLVSIHPSILTFTVVWVGLQKHPWITVRRSPPLLWSGTVEAARGPVPVPGRVYKCTSTLSPRQQKLQQSTFHPAKSLLKTSVYKQGKKVVRPSLKRYVSDMLATNSVTTPALVACVQESYLSTSDFLAWRHLTFPFGIPHHTYSTRKKTCKSASESGGWKSTCEIVASQGLGGG